ncbi:MAG: NAD-binding protein [Hyphomicrobiales bacterium]|nr:NAD-binding protein [Hyphomicrobiales bacterium]
MQKTNFDAIAIGGGLAGCAFAITLARAGHRVALLERTAKAKPKVCGDFLSAEAQGLLARLDIDIWQMDARPVSIFRMAAGGRAADAPLPFCAAGLSRLKLDEVLLQKASDAGVEIIRGESVTSIEFVPSGIEILAGGNHYTADAAALATGKINLRGYPRSTGKMTAFKMSFELTKAASAMLDGRVQLFGYDGGYIGASLIEGGASTLCWLADPAFMRRTNARWQAQLDALKQESPYIGDLLSGAKPLFERPATTAAIPYGYKRHEPIHDKLYPVGDQISVIPSFTGDGTSIALLSGVEAAHALLQGKSAGAFQRDYLQRLASQFRWANAIDMAFKSSMSRKIGVAAIGQFPALATQLTKLTRLANPAVAGIG